MPPRSERRRRRNMRLLENNADENGGANPPPPPPPPPPPLHMPDLVQFWTQATQFMTTMMTNMQTMQQQQFEQQQQFQQQMLHHFQNQPQPQPRDRERVEGCSSSSFFRHNFESFDGSIGPIAADSWIINIQHLMEFLQCTDAQKVNYASLKLTGEASHWWLARKGLIADELGKGVPITWERFKKEFDDRFFPQTQRLQCARDFQNFKQGTMTVEQYAVRFNELSRYAPTLVATEENKVHRFLYGLSPRVRDRVICLGVKNYLDMVDRATLAEKSMKEVATDFAQKKRNLPPPTHPSKKQAMSGSGSNSYGNLMPNCVKCGKTHLESCRYGIGVCFLCGKSGHMKSGCPQLTTNNVKPQWNNYQPKQLAQARVYSLTPANNEKEAPSTDVVTADIVRALGLEGSSICQAEKGSESLDDDLVAYYLGYYD